MRHRHLPAAILFAAAVVPAQQGLVRYVVDAPTPGQRLQLHQHFDVAGACCGGLRPDGPVDVVLDAVRVPLLLALAPQARLVSDGRPWHLVEQEAMAAGVDPDASYYTVAEIEAEIDALVLAHPGFAQKVDLSALPGGALTHEGRRIYALKVSDNVANDEDEPAVVMAAQHHARELNSPHMVVRAMQRILGDRATDPAIAALVDGRELWFVPMVNPDGVNQVWNVNSLWRKNRRNNGGSYGVDLNRNYPFLWGLCGASTTASSDTYRGPSAGSEPETVVLRNLVARVRPEVYLDVHSFGQDVLRLWAPCATVHPTMQAFQQAYCDRLRAPMTYDTRDPSASGEAPEDHYSTGGALSFLIEVGTDFQPVFSATATEEARVWPGVRDALLQWQPAFRGHVRSALGGAPLAATITFSPSVLNHGEVTRSRARDGRYGLWLPTGSWSVTFSAPGHDPKTLPVTVAALDQGQPLDVFLEPTAAAATLTKAGSGSIGTQVTFTYGSPGDAGRQVLFGWSLGTSPGIPLGGQRTLPLNHDFLFDLALGGNPILAPTWTTLDGADQAQCMLTLPNEDIRFALQRTDVDEVIVCSETEHADLFYATIGGLGLTGVILWAEFTLSKIDSPMMNTKTERFTGYSEYVEISKREDATFTVAWFDSVSGGSKFMRGLFNSGEFIHHDHIEEMKGGIPIPMNAPENLLNQWTMKMFNSLYYRKNIQNVSQKIQHYVPFFYPLDSLKDWNKLYGKKGFVQYQCVIPHESAEESIQHIVRHMQTKKMGSFLVVLKSFGTIKSRGLMSFPMPGMTLAMDFPMRGSETLNLLSYFDDIVHEAGGRVYPAKDARMSGEHFRSWYPGFEQMIKLKDPKISSDFWKRVMK